MKHLLSLGLAVCFLGTSEIASAADKGALIFECPNKSAEPTQAQYSYFAISRKNGWMPSGQMFMLEEEGGTIIADPTTGRFTIKEKTSSGGMKTLGELPCKRVDHMKVFIQGLAAKLKADEDGEGAVVFNAELTFSDPSVQEKFERHIDEIKSQVLGALKNVTASQLNKDGGKFAVCKLIRYAANRVMGYNNQKSDDVGVIEVSLPYLNVI